MVQEEFLAIRMDKQLKKALEKLADEDGRTLSNYIRFYLKKLVDEKEKAKK